MKIHQTEYIAKLSLAAYRTRIRVSLSKYSAIGVIGGMGQAATEDLFREISQATRELIHVKNDQDYIPVHISSIGQTPDRTEYILNDLGINGTNGQCEDPFPYLVQSYANLRKASPKIKYLGIPCNSAHYFVPALQRIIDDDGSGVKIINMIEETAKYVASLGIKKVGLLATTGSLLTQIYHRALLTKGIEVLIPDKITQESLVMDAIYGTYSQTGIKMGYHSEPKRQLQQVSQILTSMGAEVIIAGCTEIPLVMSSQDIRVPMINPTQILAQALVKNTLLISIKLDKINLKPKRISNYQNNFNARDTLPI